jgi:uncharacterized protein YneF (UPF0154 family)
MKRSLALAVAMVFASGTALAGHCPLEMKVIDEALAKNPKLTEAQMKDVKKFRAEGEAQHKAGKHAESVASLTKAQKILGVKPAKS